MAPEASSNGSRASRLTLARRHAMGRAAMAQAIAYWTTRSGLSYQQFQSLGDWASGEKRLLIGSQLARMRHAGVRSPHMSVFEGLYLTNQALANWQHDSTEALRTYGPLSAYSNLSPEALDGAFFLYRPDAPSEPLTFCDWINLFTGRLELPYIDSVVLNERDTAKLVEELATLVNDVIAELGLGPRDGIARFMDAYPVKDPGRRQRLKELVLFGTGMDPAEMEDEMAAVAETIRSLRNLPPDSFGPTQLYSELTSGRRRS